MEHRDGVDAEHRTWRLIGAFVTFKAFVVIGGVVTVVLAAMAVVAGAQHQADVQGVSAIGLQIPAPALEAYQLAADTCEGLDWSILAGIGQEESHHGAVQGGVFDDAGTLHPPLFGVQLSGSGFGNNTSAYPIGQYLGMWGLQGPYEQAIGPMQFIPRTLIWAQTDGNGDGVVDPQNIYDAAMSAAFYLCHQSGGSITDVAAAIGHYNGWDEYVEAVLQNAALYSTGGGAGEWSNDVQALLENPNVCLADRARSDLEDGRVDPRLVAALSGAATQVELCVGWFITGHAACVRNTGTYPDCKMSNHFFGRAADITHVGGEIVHAGNASARRLADWWFDGSFTGITPDSLGSPWAEAFGFTDAAHQTHLHLAYYAGGAAGDQNGTVGPPPPTATPRPTAPKIHITDLYGPNGALGSQNPLEMTTGNIFSQALVAAATEASSPPVSTRVPFGQVPDNTNGSGPHQQPADSQNTNESGPHQQPSDSQNGNGSGPHQQPQDNEPVGNSGAVVNPFTLQAAIASRQPGQVIELSAGEYGPLVVTGTTPLVLVGPDRGTAQFTNPGGVVLWLDGPSSVSISAVTIADGHQGIRANATNLVVQNSDFVGIDRDAITVGGGSVVVTGSEFTQVGFGVVAHDAAAQLSDVTMTVVSAHPVWTHGQSQLQVNNSVFVDSGHSAVNSSGSATVVGNFIGDVGSDPAVMTSGAATIVGNVMWANTGIAVFSTGTGSVLNNVFVDGSAAGTAVAAGNATGPNAGAVLPPVWMAGSEPVPAARQVVADLVAAAGF